MMKKTIPACLVAAVMTSAPALAAADACSPGKKHRMHGFYDHPHHYRHHHPMHARKFYQDHPRPYWYQDRPYGDRPYGQEGAERSGDPADAPQSEARADIVDTASKAGNFSTLIEALKTAGLTEILQGPGPYTVFAPSDEAFSKMPQAIRSAIIGDKDALKDLLTYHVVAGELSADDVARLNSAETVQGSAIAIDRKPGLRVDGANIVTADIRATNGIIHVIDAVMIPN